VARIGPPAGIRAAAARAVRKAPVGSTSRTARNRSGGVSSGGPGCRMPALGTATSGRIPRAAGASKAASVAATSVPSSLGASPPGTPGGGFRSASTTRAPCPAIARATARPMPRAASVESAVRPSRSSMPWLRPARAPAWARWARPPPAPRRPDPAAPPRGGAERRPAGRHHRPRRRRPRLAEGSRPRRGHRRGAAEEAEPSRPRRERRCPLLVIDVELDTVPPGEAAACSVPRLALAVRGGRPMGPGAGDMKAAAATMLALASSTGTAPDGRARCR
jgi:hypothetical protein